MRTGRGVVTLTTIGIVFAIVFALSSFDTPALAASTTITSLSCAPPSLVVMTDTTSQCTARISGAEGTVSGETVTFSQTGGTGGASFTSSKTCRLSGTSCTVAVTGSSPGQVIFQASYAGDANNAASSGTASVSVVQGTTTTSVSCTPPLAEGAMQFEVSLSSPCTATVSGWGGMISGEV